VIDALLLLLTFALGAALARVSLCAVAGVQRAMSARDYSGLQRLALAASGAGVVLLLLAGLAQGSVLLPGAAPFHAGIIIGGVFLGLGALVNGGCYLGSVLYLGSGNLNFLFTLAGIGAGARVTESLALLPAGSAAGARVAMGYAWVGGALGFALLTLVLLWRARPAARWLALLAGALAGLVYARHPGWSYGTVLDALAHGRFSRMDWSANLSALLLFAGALAGAWLAGSFRLQRPEWRRGLRCAAGGLIMGCGAALVPGGNDSLLLWAIPGLTLYGALAYLIMLGTIAAGFALEARRTPEAR
jgi:toxin CptA